MLIGLLRRQQVIALGHEGGRLQHSRMPNLTKFARHTPFTHQERQSAELGHAYPVSLNLRPNRCNLTNTIKLLFITTIMRNLHNYLFHDHVNKTRRRRPIRNSTTVNSHTNFVRIRHIRTDRYLRKFRLLRRHVIANRARNNRHRIRQDRRRRTFKGRTCRTNSHKGRNLPPFTNKRYNTPAASHVGLQGGRRSTRQCRRRNRRFRGHISTLIRIKRNFLMCLNLHNRHNNMKVTTSHVSLSRYRTKSHNNTKVRLLPRLITRNAEFTNRRKFIRFRSPNLSSLPINQRLFTNTSPRRIIRRSLIIKRLRIPTIAVRRRIKNRRSK